MNFSEDDKKIMQEACLNAIYALRKEMLLENNMNEYGGSEILYHFTSLPGLLSMLLNNGQNGGYFQFGRPDGEEDQIINAKMAGNKEPYTHYMSLTRSHDINWGYGKAVNDISFGKKDKKSKEENTHDKKLDKIPLSNVGTVRLTFDGRELTKGRVIKAIDFFGKGNTKKGPDVRTVKTKSGAWAGKKESHLRYPQIKQQEDRIFSNTYDFDGVLNYVTRIDVLVNRRPNGLRWANKILTAAIGTPVENKIHIYDDIKYYNRINSSRLQTSLNKAGISNDEWRKEITGEFKRDYVFKTGDIITNSDAKLIAIFVWALLFYDYSRAIRESTFNYNLTSLFPLKEVSDRLSVYLKTIRGGKVNIAGKPYDLSGVVRRMVLKQYSALSNKELIDFLMDNKSYKLASCVGIARTVLGPLKDAAMSLFNTTSLKSALHSIGNIFKEYFPGYEEIMASDSEAKEKKKKSREKFINKKNQQPAAVKEPELDFSGGQPDQQQVVSRRGRKPSQTSSSIGTQPIGTAIRKGRKPNDFAAPIPSLQIRGLGTIFNVKSMADARDKVSNLCKNADLFNKTWTNSLMQKIYKYARASKMALNEWTDRINMAGTETGWCIIVVGGPGSGKSYFIKNYLPINGEVFDIDAYRQKYLESIKDTDQDAYKRMSKRDGFKELTTNTIGFIKNAEINFLKTHAQSESNVIFDIGGRKDSDILDVINLVKPFGYKIGICWVVCNRSVAMMRNINRGANKEGGRIIIPDKPFHQRTNGVNRVVPAFLQGSSSKDVDAAWIVLTSSNSLTPMTDAEKSECVLELEKSGNGFIISDEDIEKINGVLGPKEKSNNFTPETYLSNSEIKKLNGERNNFLRENTEKIKLSDRDIQNMVNECVKQIIENIL